jgi:hypothetical protein
MAHLLSKKWKGTSRPYLYSIGQPHWREHAAAARKAGVRTANFSGRTQASNVPAAHPFAPPILEARSNYRLAREMVMTWLVLLHGAYWRDVSPDVFREHRKRDDWSELLCDTVDTSGGMLEVEHDGLKILIPRNAVIAAVNLQDKKQMAVFGLPSDAGSDHG